MLVRLFALGLVILPLRVGAQGFPKQAMVADWERSRTNVLAYIDAMPDSALFYRPTPGVRNFAEQIDHIVSTNLEVAARALKGEKEMPKIGDPQVYLKDKGALRDYSAKTYDYVLKAIKGATAAQLDKPTAMFNQPAQAGWRWLMLSHEHSAWTLGQVIPYLRLNKVTPPAYQMPF